jgi:hypothetical protein
MNEKLERANLLEDIRKLKSKLKVFENLGNMEQAEKCRKKANRLEAKLKLMEISK